MAKVAGYVKTIRVDIGDHVRQNDVLATLEAPEIQDDVAKAKAGVPPPRLTLSPRGRLSNGRKPRQISPLYLLSAFRMSRRETAG